MNRHRHVFTLLCALALLFGNLGMPPTLANDLPPVSGETALPTVAGPLFVYPDTPVVARLYISDPASFAMIASGLDIWETHPEAMYVVIAVTSEEYQWLAGLGYRLEIDRDKTDRLNQPRQPLPGQTEGIPGYLCYRTVEETFASAQAIANNYPTLAQWTDIGNSWEKSIPGGLPGYDIMLLKLTNTDVPGPKPKVFIMSAIHAREYSTAELNTRFAEYLINNYGIDADVTGLLDFYEIHLVIHTNPDGRKLAEAGDSWRKNTDTTCPAYPSYRGVDLNRNFPFQWGCCGGSSGDGCDDTYHGASASSEPETLAIVNYVQSQFPDQREPDLNAAAPLTSTGIFLDLHSYGGDVMWPWGFTPNAPPNAPQLQTLGRKMAYFNGYDPHQSYSLYPTDGTTKEFAYGELGMAGYTVELGTDFFEPCSNFENTILPDNLPMLFYAAKAARRPYQLPYGPDSLNVTVTPTSTIATLAWPPGQAGLVTLTAVANDTRYQGSEPVQNIAAARYTVDKPSWHTDVISYPMTAADGNLNSSIETVIAAVDTTGWTPGRHTLFVESKDANGNWGVPTAAFVWVTAAPDSAIVGTVRSSATGDPLAGAMLHLTGGASPQQMSTGPDGQYAFDVFSGTYTITATALYHYSSVLHVTAQTGVTTTQDITLTAVPSGTLTGFVREAATGFPLEADVQAVSAMGTYHTTADPATGLYSLSVLSDTYTVSVTAGGHVPLAQAGIVVTGYQTKTLNFDLAATACVLLVDDDGGRSYESYFRTALNGVGVMYDTWTVAAQGGPNAAALEPYTAVVWFTGDDGTFQTLTVQDRAALTSYLQGGGHLFLTGTEIGVANQFQPFYTNVLSTQFVADDSGVKTLNGLGLFDEIELKLNGGDGANNQAWPDAVAPLGAAQNVFSYTNGLGGGVAIDAGTYRAINLGFGVEGIDKRVDRLEVMRTGLEWLGCAGLEHAWKVSKQASAPVVWPGERLTYTLSVSHTSLVSATNVVITDALPAHTVFAGASDGGVVTNGVVSWTLPELAPQQALDLTVAVTATGAPSGTALVNAVYGVSSEQTPEPVWGQPVTVTLLSTGAPAINLDTYTVTVVQSPGSSTTQTLTIRNAGDADLIWQLSAEPGVDWLSAAPISGTLMAAASDQVVLNFDATGLPAGSYTTTLRIASNDPAQPQVDVNVMMTVTCGPVSDVGFGFIPAEPKVGQLITFTAIANVQSLTELPLSFAWEFGDGSLGNGRVVTHTFRAMGMYTVSVTATNACGNWSDVAQVVSVRRPHTVYLPLLMKTS